MSFICQGTDLYQLLQAKTTVSNGVDKQWAVEIDFSIISEIIHSIICEGFHLMSTLRLSRKAGLSYLPRNIYKNT